MSKGRILVVEDEEDILELIRFNLSRDGYDVDGVAHGEDALRAVRKELPDLMILDLMLPGLDGLEVCRRLRQEPATRHLPIIMLTARGEEPDVVAGLEVGADDYVTKPFSPRVLLARVKSILRRSSPEPEPDEEKALRMGGLTIHSGRREVLLGSESLALTATEFNLLLLLTKRPGWVFTRQQIIDAVRGDDYHITDRAVDVQVAGLRKKLGASGSHIQTVRGVGYRFAE